MFNHPNVNSVAFHACVVSTLGLNPWTIDFDATNHMIPHKHLLHNLTTLVTSFLITLPNGYKVKVIPTDSLHLILDITLHKISLVSFFRFNLISVYKLLTQLDYDALFTKSNCILQGLSLRKQLKISRAVNGLYFLNSDSLYSLHIFLLLFTIMFIVMLFLLMLFLFLIVFLVPNQLA